MQFLTPLYTGELYTNLCPNDDHKFAFSCFVFFLLFLGIVAPTRRPKLPFPGNNTQITYTLMMKLHLTFNMQDIYKRF